ncbi:hypothetical protein BKP56_09250 [Marinilactibacillus sp. 15R]|uniref:hypothetical protein n=1 Tax=Marinilactibacillus sp. 15R TaxID=1911586 RepID=UPI000909E2C5|nr:hypothetical protein [Marinilactibacillus sp. 15R]API89428.1 hypothetical protein BKP56_09250 [Marinilactibacillus sp. 15R]
MKTIFELKQDLSTIGQQIQKTNNEIVQKATEPATTAEQLSDLEKSKTNLQQRFDILNGQLQQMENEQKENLSKGTSVALNNLTVSTHKKVLYNGVG